MTRSSQCKGHGLLQKSVRKTSNDREQHIGNYYTEVILQVPILACSPARKGMPGNHNYNHNLWNLLGNR